MVRLLIHFQKYGTLMVACNINLSKDLLLTPFHISAKLYKGNYRSKFVSKLFLALVNLLWHFGLLVIKGYIHPQIHVYNR